MPSYFWFRRVATPKEQQLVSWVGPGSAEQGGTVTRAGGCVAALLLIAVGAGAGVQPQRVDASVATLSAGPALPACHPQLSVGDAGAGVAAEAGGGAAAGGRGQV